MADFDALWKTSVRFRKVSRELEPLLRATHHDVARADLPALKSSLERLLIFLATTLGRTDANLTTTHYFFTACEAEWRALPDAYCAILDDMSGTLHESVYAPNIAKTFEATPEQLLERLRAL
jgi:hypothetical protein